MFTSATGPRRGQFVFKFDNGVTASVVWGVGLYSGGETFEDAPSGESLASAETAELGVRVGTGHYEVCGYLTAEEVAVCLAYLASPEHTGASIGWVWDGVRKVLRSHDGEEE